MTVLLRSWKGFKAPARLKDFPVLLGGAVLFLTLLLRRPVTGQPAITR